MLASVKECVLSGVLYVYVNVLYLERYYFAQKFWRAQISRFWV